MQQIIIDKEFLKKLHDLREPLELFDGKGRRLGIVQADPSRDRDLLRTMEIPIVDDELRRIELKIQQGCRRYTTAEVLANLRGVETT